MTIEELWIQLNLRNIKYLRFDTRDMGTTYPGPTFYQEVGKWFIAQPRVGDTKYFTMAIDDVIAFNPLTFKGGHEFPRWSLKVLANDTDIALDLVVDRSIQLHSRGKLSDLRTISGDNFLNW